MPPEVKPMKPEEILALIHAQRGTAICVPTMTTSPAWRTIAPDDLSVGCVGFMGGASSLGLGLALAQPDRRVLVLDGDGSLLMQMGCLSTIATLAPKNLTMIVMDNGVYQITGAQPTPGAALADIVAIAQGCGLADSAWAADEDDFERLVDQSMAASGPSLIAVRIDDKPGVGTTDRDPVQIRQRFMLGLGVRQAL